MKKNLIKIMSILLMGATLVTFTGCRSKNEIVKNTETRIEDSGMSFNEIKNKIATTDEFINAPKDVRDAIINVVGNAESVEDVYDNISNLDNLSDLGKESVIKVLDAILETITEIPNSVETTKPEKTTNKSNSINITEKEFIDVFKKYIPYTDDCIEFKNSIMSCDMNTGLYSLNLENIDSKFNEWAKTATPASVAIMGELLGINKPYSELVSMPYSGNGDALLTHKQTLAEGYTFWNTYNVFVPDYNYYGNSSITYGTYYIPEYMMDELYVNYDGEMYLTEADAIDAGSNHIVTVREWLEDKYEHDFLSGKTTARKVCCVCGYEYLSQSNSLKRNDIMSLASSPCTHCGETEAIITYVGNVEDGDLVRDSLTHAITTNQIADCNLIAKYDDNNLVGHEYVLTRDVVSKYAKNK